MIVGLPKEIKNNEHRVGLTPDSVSEISANGHEVFVETNCGKEIGFTNERYESAGAKILNTASEVYEKSELIVKVKEPMESEVHYLNSETTLFTYLHLAGNPLLAKKLIDTGVRGIAYETVTSPDNTFPLLAPMSAIAGQIAFNVGNYFLLKQNRGRGVLIGTLNGVDLGLVTIIGCGVAGEEALQKALKNGVQVNLIDLSEERLFQLKSKYGDEKINYIASTPKAIGESIKDSDLILGSVYSHGKNAPKVITDNMLDFVKPGAVMVDISIDQGGCFETSSPTTHDDPTFVHKGIVHYCVTNMPGAVPLTASNALNRATISYIHELTNKGIDKALNENKHLKDGLNIDKKDVPNKLVREALDSLLN
tara:strand:+ start:1783 stop:2880 length:1098 start_codon:yes stop_codon:yes gene_type:complete